MTSGVPRSLGTKNQGGASGRSSPLPRIAIFIPALHRGGTESQTLALSRALLGAGYAVQLCCYFEAEAETLGEFQRIGVRVDLLGLRPPESTQRPAFMIALAWSLFRYLRALRPDVVHVQYIAPGLLPVAVARIARVRLVLATVHQLATPYGRRERWMLRLAAWLCRAFLSVSGAVEESWFGNSQVFGPDGPPSRRRHFTIYNGVDVEAFRSARLADQTSPLRHQLSLADRPVVTVVGRLRWEKGQATLVRAMSQIAREVPEAVLLVVGDGPDREALGRQVAEAGLAERTVWAGMRSAEELPAFYGLSTVVAVPSVFEGFGLVAAEAMAAGTPVVASAVGGLREVVEDGVTGLLVPPGDAGALASAVIRILRDPALGEEMGRRGRDRVRALFSLERFEASTLAAYRRFGKIGGVAGAGR